MVGPGGRHQWQPSNGEKLMMLTTDVALLHDPSYLNFVNYYNKFNFIFGDHFQRAWYKLTTRDMGPVTRCLGPNVPPAQPFQYPLPPTPSLLANFNTVRSLIVNSLYAPITSSGTPADIVNGQYYYGALYVQLAYQCANTFRATDFRGGCNGATIRFSPQKDWAVNVGMGDVLDYLGRTVKSLYNGGGALSWADLIVLAGQTALEEAGAFPMRFCGGRVDANDGTPAEGLQPRVYSNAFTEVWDNMEVMGLNAREMVALQGKLRGSYHQVQLGYGGSWTSNPSILSNGYFTSLLDQDWTFLNGQFVSNNGTYLTSTDMPIKYQPEFLVVAEEYYTNQNAFFTDFSAAWTKLMNADRFDGPTGNLCN